MKMMMKLTRCVALILAVLCLAGCGKDSSGGAGHTHAYGDAWQKDKDNHWLICECGEKKDLAAHAFEDNTCTTCGAYKSSDGLEFKQTGDSYTVVGVAGNTDITLVIPTEYDGASVKTIGESYATYSALKGIVATKVVVPEGITRINARAFWLCETVETIELPASLQTIEHYAFWTCTALKELKLPEGITSIGEYTFSKCTSMTRIYIPASVTAIDAGAFNDCAALADIDFGGTMAQWGAVTKGYKDMFGNIVNWNNNSGNYTIHCTDGDITKV